MENNMSAIDKLFDESNNDNIVLYNGKGEPTEFEQIAIIPLGDKVYAILALADPSEDIAEDEGIIFSVETDKDGKRSLQLVTDDEVIGSVFDVYESLIAELEKGGDSACSEAGESGTKSEG